MAAVDTIVQEYKDLSDADKQAAYLKIRDLELRDVPLPACNEFPDSLRDIFQRAGVQGKEEDLENADGFRSAFSGAPQSVAALESTSTALAKWWAGAIGAGGPLAAIAAAWLGWWQALWSVESVRPTVVLCVAAVAASVLFSIAIIVSADLRGRSMAQSAIYTARAALGAAYIASAQACDVNDQLANMLELALRASPTKRVRVSQHGKDVDADAYRRTVSGGVEVHDAASQTWIPLQGGAYVSPI